DARATQLCDATGAWVAGEACDGPGLACASGACVDRCAAAGTSYLGCDYWPTVTSNTRLRDGFTYAVALANPQTYPVHADVTGGGLGGGSRSLDLAPGEVRVVPLPWVTSLSQHASDAFPLPDPVSVLVPGGAYHVHTDGPVAAYQFNPLEYQSSSGNYSL